MEFETNEYKVTFKDDQATKDALFQKVIEYCKRNDAWCGETVMQCDAPQLEAPELLSDIVDDILKPKMRWK